MRHLKYCSTWHWTFLAALASASAAFSQTPLGAELRVNEETYLTQDTAHVAVSQDGSFAIGWRSARGQTSPYEPFGAVRFYDAQGQALTGDISLSEGLTDFPWLLAKPGGGYRLLWGGPSGSQYVLFLQDRSPSGEALGAPVTRPLVDPRGMTVANIAITPAGRMALAWLSSQYEMDAARLGAQGQLLGSQILIAQSQEGDPLGFGDIEVDRQGNAVVTWTDDCGSFNRETAHCDVFAQRISNTGQKLGGPIRLNTFRQGIQALARVAVAPDGRFLTVWETNEPKFPDNPFAIDVFGQLFSASGAKIGPELRLGTVPNFSELFPQASADPNGNFLAVWSSFRRENDLYSWDVLGQLFRHDGQRVGKVFRVNTRGTFNEFPKPEAAFGGNGTFVVVWNANDFDFDGVYAQRFMASPADEVCVVRGTSLLCDAGRTGGQAELQLSLPDNAIGDPLVFGDADGDGRKDPCVFQGGLFRCDTDHRGEPYEMAFRFGKAGDVPLFGDVDGDGREEPCIRLGTRTFCDTRRNGGQAEVIFSIGQASDQPLLGDLDGDGRDDACVFDGARFLCDTQHNNRADVTILFGQRGDLATMGDVDGDGDDDPCVFRAGRWLCDTAHNGGTAEVELAFGTVGDRPLLGNLDGL